VDNEQKNRIIAEKVMGWRQDAQATCKSYDYWEDCDGDFQEIVPCYKPTENLTQALDALREYWLRCRRFDSAAMAQAICEALVREL